MSNNNYEIWTDGACSGNPGPGGYGVVMVHEGKETVLQGFEPNTTNNRMELLAAITALDSVQKGGKITIHTDSQYVKNGINDWIKKWQKNNWRTADNKPVKNVDLWQKLLAACQKHEIKWDWVKGHDGNIYNEKADALATSAISMRVK